MPRGKGFVKTITGAKRQGKKSKSEDSVDCSDAENMKETVETATAAKEERETGQTESPLVDATADIGDMSVDSREEHGKESEEDSLPNKPKRLFMITGCKKKDAKRNKSEESEGAKNAEELKEDPTQASDGDATLLQEVSITDTSSLNDVRATSENVSLRNSSVDDEHPYEDPSLLVNNSTTPHEDNKNNSTRTTKASKKMKKQDLKHEQRAHSPGFGKTAESTKADAKGTKEKRPSVMSEHSIARSIFAFLVALLLSLITFLAFFFLLASHPVLAIVLSILLYTIVFMTLGFLDATRLKCLVLLVLPSSCSEGGKLSIYLLLLYFTIKGPLCNTIGNISSVRGLIKCVDSERANEHQMTKQTFNLAQNCVDSRHSKFFTKNNQSVEASLGCLKKICFSVKKDFKQRCGLENPRISPKVCSLAQGLSCNSSQFQGISESCPKVAQIPCQSEFDEILGFLKMNEQDSCGFLDIVGMLLPLLILLLLHEAYNYEKNYQTYNNFHNYFLTGHFQCIDQGRSSCDREAVLPLRKVELRKHVRPAVCHLNDSEKSCLYESLKTYILFLVFVLFIILVDYYTFKMFNISDQSLNAPAFVDSEGGDFKKGGNLFQKIENVSSIGRNGTNVTSFRISDGNHANNITTKSYFSHLPGQDTCSVTVESPGGISKMIIPILLSILLILILLQAYIARFRWYICSRFYNNREKERVFYLYNKILEDRVLLVEKCRKQMKCYNREMKTLRSIEPTRILAQQGRWFSKVFKFFHINLRKCVICNDSEKSAFKVCHGADCSGVYCLECSFDIDKKCLYCDTELKRSLSVKKECDKESLV